MSISRHHDFCRGMVGGALRPPWLQKGDSTGNHSGKPLVREVETSWFGSSSFTSSISSFWRGFALPCPVQTRCALKARLLKSSPQDSARASVTCAESANLEAGASFTKRRFGNASKQHSPRLKKAALSSGRQGA